MPGAIKVFRRQICAGQPKPRTAAICPFDSSCPPGCGSDRRDGNVPALWPQRPGRDLLLPHRARRGGKIARRMDFGFALGPEFQHRPSPAAALAPIAPQRGRGRKRAAAGACIRAGLMAALPLDSGVTGANTGKQSRRNQAVSHD